MRRMKRPVWYTACRKLQSIRASQTPLHHLIELQKRYAEPLDSDCEPGRIPMIKITPEEIRLLSQYIYKISGIVLDDKKAYLFESRLARLLEEQTCASFKELYLKAASDRTQKLERKITFVLELTSEF